MSKTNLINLIDFISSRGEGVKLMDAEHEKLFNKTRKKAMKKQSAYAYAKKLWV